VVGWLAGWLKNWIQKWIQKLDHGIRAIQFSEMDDPISDPISRSIFSGDTSAAERST
jgi:hypothetical protein